jgi:hypothetical protein
MREKLAREGAFLVLRGMLSGSGFSFFLPLYLPLPDLYLSFGQITRKIDPRRRLMGLGKKRVDVCRSRTRLHSPQIQGLPAAMISARIRIQVNLLLSNLRWREPINFCSCSYIPPSISLFFSVYLGGGWISCGGHAYELHEMQIGVMMRPHDCMVAHAVAHFYSSSSLGISFSPLSFPCNY